MSSPQVIIVTGVSGVGKTTVGRRLAQLCGRTFIEGDELHPPANIAKMHAGVALTDEDRWPWLDALGAAIERARTSAGVVATCSALKRSYRDRLRSLLGSDVVFAFLRAERAVVQSRIEARAAHFMPAALLDSQLRTVELPAADEPVVTVDAGRDLLEILDVLRPLCRSGAEG